MMILENYIYVHCVGPSTFLEDEDEDVISPQRHDIFDPDNFIRSCTHRLASVH